ncbi:MAG: sulfurtransferase [Chloroflexi bacterium]|nr:sulfurtransferase [Chloroflexota bacterium]
MTWPIVVDSRWLEDHLHDGDLSIVDVRPPQFYGQGHVPGAVNLPIFLLSGPGGRPPETAALGARLSAAGVGVHHHVVAYDDGGSPSAAVLVYLLQYYRHERVSLLDGGITRWAHEGRQLEYRPAQRAPERYVPGEPDDALWTRMEGVRRAIDEEDAVLLDVRSPAEYLGLQVTAHRDGHVPGAVNVEWSNNLAEEGDGLPILRPDEELRRIYEGAGVTPDKRVIVYCQAGTRTAETFVALKKLGYPRVSVYLPGWQEWGNRPDTPVDAA